jgi:8-oxo-dGTP pyrophosphatase MutT (NUDIX family)
MRPTAACVLVLDSWPNPRRLLAVSRGTGSAWWALPGGLIEAGERPVTAAKRELFEETGLVVHTRNLGLIYDGISVNSQTGQRARTQTFLAYKWSGHVRASSEGDVAWKRWETLFRRSPWGQYIHDLWETLAQRAGRSLGAQRTGRSLGVLT